MTSKIHFSGYSECRLISSGLRSHLLEAKRAGESRCVALKISKSFPATEEERAALEHEVNMLSKLSDTPFVPEVYAIERRPDSLALSMEWIPYPSLSEILDKKRRLEGEAFFCFAFAVLEALAAIHKKDIIHRDISEHNILYDEETGRCKVVDFSLAVDLPLHKTLPRNPELIEGTLAYISPEQTGRMNRGSDYRCDYYSLGVLFYRVLTGELPFLYSDPVELVYAHLAINPEPPSRVEEFVPRSLSAVVVKLLAKEPEERYQSIAGIRGDLAHCQEALKEGNSDPFPLGSHDTYQRFLLPKKIYGREEELDLLLERYEEVAHGASALVFIAGYAGVGKSSLVHELYKPIAEKQGIIISGKCDEFKRKLPYYAFNQAFEEYIDDILSRGEGEREKFKKEFLDAVGRNGKIISDAVSNLALLVGEQPPLPTLGVEETKNRFSHTMQKFIELLPTAKQPLIIFLDDLQWSDSSTLKLIERLSTIAIPHLMIVAGYRDNEVGAAHPIAELQGNLEKGGVPFSSLKLAPLKLSRVQEIVADTLLRSSGEVAPLAEICFKKTEGNPFFLLQFLEKLYTSKLIYYDWEGGKWLFEREEIAHAAVSDNVVDLMIEKIEELPLEERSLLKRASAIGNSFSLSLLKGIALQERGEEKPLRSIVERLMQKELLFTAEKNYYSADLFRFTHDRIQQAAYNSLDIEEKRAIHSAIADQLVAASPGEKRGELLFTIVNHYNQLLDFESALPFDKGKRDEIARLSFDALKAAKESSAHEMALKYFEAALQWLGREDWEGNYRFLLDLYSEAVESAYLHGDEKRVALYIAHLREQGRETIDLIRAIVVEALQEAHHGRHDVAKAILLEPLEEMHFPLPKDPGKGRVALELIAAACRLLLFRRSIEELAKLPACRSREDNAVFELASTLGLSLVMEKEVNLFPIAVLRLLRKSLKSGNSDASPLIYAAIGAILMGIGQVEKSFRFAKLGLSLLDSSPRQSFYGGTTFVSLFLVFHAKEPLNTLLPQFNVSYNRAMELGDIKWGAMLLAHHTIVGMQTTFTPLDELQKNIEKSSKILGDLCFEEEREWVDEILFFTERLLGSSSHEEAPYDSAAFMEKLGSLQFETSHWGFYSCSAIYTFLFREFEATLFYCGKLSSVEEEVPGSTYVPLYLTYQTLASIALYKGMDRKRRLFARAKIAYGLFRLRSWANHGPNYRNNYLLAKAEWWRVRGNREKAEIAYIEAIEAAAKGGLLGEEALALELAGRFYLDEKWNRKGAITLKEAWRSYLRWGAQRKAELLEKEFGALFPQEERSAEEREEESVEKSSSKTMTASLGGGKFDLFSLQKSAEAVASTIVLEKLTRKLVSIVMESAGAEKCLLLMEREGRYTVEVEGNSRLGEVRLIGSLEVAKELLPVTILQRVIHYKKVVLLENAFRDRQYNKDYYIKSERVLSALFVPLINNGKITAILYLENNLMRKAFTSDHLKMLYYLSGQLAMSIDNAKLYRSLEKINASYERFVPKDFIALLGRKSILDVVLGDYREREMSVLFMDIRSFTKLSEAMSPKENFFFINEFLCYMEPAIRSHSGFIDKYIGDAIMALFPTSADDALRCSIAMLQQLDLYNELRRGRGEQPIDIGIGINSGSVILGTVGNDLRMDGTVISDTVNVASRVEHLTKEYKAHILLTEKSYSQLQNPSSYPLVAVGETPIRGKEKPLLLYALRRP